MIDEEGRVREQMDTYRASGFPAAWGLIACTFMLRRHHEADVRQFDDLWFQHVLRYSKRDQLSFPFCAWKQHLRFTEIEEDLTSNELFQWPVGERPIPYGFSNDEYLWLNPDVAKAGIDPQDHMFTYGHKERRPYKYHRPIALDILANKYKSDKGRMYYNRHFYTRIYDPYLSPLRKAEMTLVEIGLLGHDVQHSIDGDVYSNAPSLYMWDEYFACAQIHGIDIADFSKAVRGKITFARADQSKPDELLSAIQMCKHDIRVIIDDASHASHHQQISWPAFFPGWQAADSISSKTLAINRLIWKWKALPRRVISLRRCKKRERPHSPFVSPQALERLTREIAAIRFFDSMDYTGGLESADALAVIIKR